jgi:hypothetical protein
VTIAHVQQVASGGTAVNSNTLILTLSGVTTTAGNHLLLQAAARSGGVSSIADSKGNTWQVDKAQSVTGAFTSLWSCRITTPLVDGDTITITNVSSTGHSASVAEFSGLASTGWADQVAGNTGTGTAADSTATATTARDDELVFGIVGHQSTVTNYAPEVLSPVWNQTTVGASVGTVQTVRGMYRIVAATGTYSAKSAWTTSRVWAAVIVTYKGRSAARSMVVSC